jgi:hypothetical protein
MKKIFLLFLLAAAVISFFFFFPIMAMILGLCCIVLGLVSIVNPAAMKPQKAKRLTRVQKAKRVARVRVFGSLLLIIGLLISYGGAAFTYEWYVDREKKNEFASSDGSGNQGAAGAGVTRPQSNPYPSPGTDTKETEKSSGIPDTPGKLDQSALNDSTSDESQPSQTNSAGTEPQPSEQNPQETDNPSHKQDPPKRGAQAELKSNRYKNK